MQSVKNSILESLTNVLIGLVTNYLFQIILYKSLNINVTYRQSAIISLSFMLFSFARSFIIRRIFNNITEK